MAEITRFVKKRLDAYIKNHNYGSTAEFCRQTGIDQNGLTNSLKRDRLSWDMLLKIIDRCSDLNMRWLLTGNGPMLIDSGIVKIPVHDIAMHRATCKGEPCPCKDSIVAHLPLSKDYLEQDGIHPQSVIGIIAPDNSMAPRIMAGAVVFVDCADCDIRDGGIYLLHWDSCIVLRRVQNLPGGSFLFRAIGEESLSITVPASAMKTVRVIGRVRWISHKEC